MTASDLDRLRIRLEYTGMRQNEARMKGNGQELHRNVPERAGMTPEYTEMSLNETAWNQHEYEFQLSDMFDGDRVSHCSKRQQKL